MLLKHAFLRKWKTHVIAMLAIVALPCSLFAQRGSTSGGGAGGLWPYGGHDVHNTRFAQSETAITPENAAELTVKWVFTTGGDVSATPAVDGTSVYFPDWAGNLYSVNRENGTENWSRTIASYGGGSLSRGTPAIFGSSLIFGDQGGRQFLGASVISVDKNTGNLNWITKVEEHPAALVTQSPVVAGNVVYVGVASNDEAWAAFIPNYICCSFRGSILALDANTGEILWKTYMVPEGTGYSGNGVWGSTPVVDVRRRLVYITTGNNYTAPETVLACVEALGAEPDAADVADCVEQYSVENNYVDSVVALDAATGVVRWATQALPFDPWTVSCLIPSPATPCPSPAGPDYDFGQGPALFTVRPPTGPPMDLLGAGQKSGKYWALDPDTGDVVWVTQAGPGGTLGGLEWGSATDGNRIYVANTLTGWHALDAYSGEILWNTPSYVAGNGFALTFGPATVANGVVFVGSIHTGADDDTMFTLDAATGEVLGRFASGGSVASGPAIVDGEVYWGSGYSLIAGSGNNKLYAFALP